MDPKTDAVKIHFVTFKDGSRFLECLEIIGQAEVGRLRVATKARFKKGDVVILEVAFPDVPSRVLLRTTAGDVIDDVPSFVIAAGEEHKRDFLVAVASGKATASAPRNRRIPMRLPARVSASGKEPRDLKARTDDLTARGAFLKTDADVTTGSRIRINLDPLDGSGEMKFEGTVMHSDDQDGVGVEFDRPNNKEMKRLRLLIRDVKVQGKLLEAEDAE